MASLEGLGRAAEARESEPVLPQPVIAATADQVRAMPTELPTHEILAMPELPMHRFGHRCDDDEPEARTGAVLAPAAAPTPLDPGVVTLSRSSVDSISESMPVEAQAPSPLPATSYENNNVFIQLESTEVMEKNSTIEPRSAIEQANSTLDVQPTRSIGEVSIPPARSFGEVRPQALSAGQEMVVIKSEEANLGKDTVAIEQGNDTELAGAPMPVDNNSTGIETTLSNATVDSGQSKTSASNSLEMSDATAPAQAQEKPLGSAPKSAPTVVYEVLSDQNVARRAVPGPKLADSVTRRSNWSMFLLMLGLLGAAMLGASCLAMGLWASSAFGWRGRSSVRTTAECLTTWSASKVERQLPRSGGYDCHFSKPVSSGHLLRLEARVEGPSTGGPALTAPLSGKASVLYSAAVSQQVHDGIPPTPVAFSAASVDFTVSLVGAPHVRVELRGEEVSLFDMCGGRLVEKCTLSIAPERWQDFVVSHRTAATGYDWQANPMHRAEGSALEFQECALLVGSIITLVGELHRGADGALTLRPLQADSVDSTGKSKRRNTNGWRTSWELGGCEAADARQREDSLTRRATSAASLTGRSEASFDKVLASDDPLLIGQGDASTVRDGCGLAGGLKPGGRGGFSAVTEMLLSSLPHTVRGRLQALSK